MKHIRFRIAIFSLPLIYNLLGCYPDKIDYLDEYDVASTFVAEEADFALYSTFTVIDTVMHVTEDEKDDPNFSRANDAYILNLLRINMNGMGYTEVENPDSLDIPDLVLAVSALSSDYNYYYSYYNYYWGWYPGYGYPGWGYPVYGGSYSTGTLIIDMWDTESHNLEEKKAGIVWTGFVDGILSGSTSAARPRLEKQINQLFIQSPYLKK